jgi:FAD/FMN-containing dehydrogenase
MAADGAGAKAKPAGKAARASKPVVASEALVAGLTKALGADAVIVDAQARRLMGMDVYREGATPTFVLRPKDAAAVAAAVRLCADAGLAIVPRGGGASYSDGYVNDLPATALIDTGVLQTIDLDELNATVTVGAGVTWARLRETLDATGWRTPFWGPFSGIAATVGGTMSQNGISHGSGAYGISAPSALSFEVALANGELIRTGSAAAGAKPVVRHFGPDLTGLFTGDCGALGVKTAITLPLIRKKQAFATLSWSFPNFASLHAGMRAAAIEGLDDEHFALDAALSQGQIAREERAGRQGKMAASVLKQKGLASGLAQLAKMGVAGDRALKEAEFMCHYIFDGVEDAEAKAKLKRVRSVLEEFGKEIPNSVPEVVRGMPFAPLFNTLGPKGERWVPLHGVVAHADALAFHVALDEFYESRAKEMARLGVWAGAMFECVGSSAFLYEIALYWPDAQMDYHRGVIDADYLSKLPTYPDNPEARAFIAQMKADLIALYARFNAAHFQIGRAYSFASRLEPQALALLQAVKAQLDPKGVMNPGVLGL